MKYAICMLIYNKPALFEKIVGKIISSNVEIFVHLDKKCNIKDYAYVNNVTFIKRRVNVHWGGRSMIDAMYNLIEYIVNETDCDYIIFISGQDFPITNPKNYDDYFNKKLNYIDYEILPKKSWYFGGISRINHYYIFNSPLSFQSRFIIKVQKLLHIYRKYWRNNFIIYGGSQWININIDAAKYILSHWEAYYCFFRYCNISDEMIFQTILLNSPLKEFIINTNYRYIMYKENALNPVYLDESNIKSILNSRAIFCRKILDENVFKKLELLMS